MISISDLKVILNKVSDLDLTKVPAGIKITIEGQSPSIFDGSSSQIRRIQGIIIKISGEKKLVDSFLKQYEQTGVYRT